MAKQTFATLQAGRGLAATAVIFYHAASYTGVDPRFWRAWPYYVNFDWGELGVEYFFVLSGIVILLAHWKDQNSPGAAPGYLWKRFRRVYPIYWCVLALIAPTFFISPHLGNGFEKNPWVLLSSVLLVHIKSHDTTLHVAWTLFHEVLFYFFFVLIILRQRLGYFVFSLWMLGSIAELFHWIPGDWHSGFFSPLHLLFGFGMLVTWMLTKYPRLNWRFPLFAGCVLLTYVLLWPPLHGLETVLWWLPAAVAFSLITLGLMELERRKAFKVWEPLNVLGAASYSIYLVHYPFLSITYRLSYRLDQTLHAPLWLWMLINVPLAIAFGILVHFAIEVPILKHLGGSVRTTPSVVLST